MSQTVQKTLVAVVGNKGGPGKSSFARPYLDYARERRQRVAAFDADTKNQSFSRFYAQRDEKGTILAKQDVTTGAAIIDIRNRYERDALVNIIEADVNHIVMDLPGGGIDDLANILGDGKQFFELYRSHGIIPIVAIICSTVPESVEAVGQIISIFGTAPYYVAVKNMHFGPPPAWFVFEGRITEGTRRWGEGRDAIAAVEGDVVEMPALDPTTYAEVAAEHLTFAEAETSPLLGMAHRTRIRSYRKAFAESLVGTALEL